MVQTLRILHVLRAPVGGLFRHVRDLAVEQAKWGLDVGILFDANSCDSLTQQRLDLLEPHLPLGLHSVPMGRAPGVGDLRCVARTAKLVRELGIDVVHGHGAKGGLYARLGGALAGRNGGRRPLRFYTPHGGSLHFFDGSVKGQLYVQAEKAMLPLTDGLIFESAFARETFTRRISLGGVEARVIHNGVGDEDFEARQLAKDAAEFLFIGELRHLKGVDVLLEALNRIRDLRARAVIVGDGPDAEAFKTQAHRLGLGARVRFTGAMPARQAFGLGRVLVVPSRAESLPYVVLEAAAAGLPLIATQVGGIPEIVSGTDTRLVCPGDAQALACAMAHAAGDVAGAEERAERLRDAVAEGFTTAAMMRQVLEFYRDGLIARSSVTDNRTLDSAEIYPKNNNS